MANDFLRKKAYYLRVVDKNGEFDLQSKLSYKKQNMNDVRSTERIVKDVLYRIQHYREDSNIGTEKNSLLLHIASSVIGKTALAMKMDCVEDKDDGKEQPAPEQHEFIDGEGFLFVQKNHIVFCSHGLTLVSIKKYLHALLNTAEEIVNFEFKNIANINKLQLLNQHGVKSFNFSASMYKMTQEYHNKQAENSAQNSRIATIFKGIIQSTKDAFSKDLSLEDQKALPELLIDVSVKLDKNTRASLDAQNYVKQEAKEILDEIELQDGNNLLSDVEFITGNGEIVKSSDIQLSQYINVKKLKQSNSVQHEDVWIALIDYFNDLSRQNFTEI